ncbi:MAG: S4 domain-containing protein [Candidatus Pacearchaeota archaeon]|nr:S4 domain-containing protein [Candidatus Pacearchaeota archaeon]
MHLKRIAAPKSWPILRKEKVFVAVGKSPHKLELSLPLIVIFRDLLKIANNTREIKKIISEKNVFINNKIVKDVNFRAGLFDRIYVKKLEKYFSIYLTEKGKLEVREINKEKSEIKPCKIIGKKTLKGGKTQINCSDGRNFITSDKFEVGDGIIVNLKNNKIIKRIGFERGNFALIIKGKNKGAHGKIEEINNIVTIKYKDKKIKIPKENLFVIEENELKK